MSYSFIVLRSSASWCCLHSTVQFFLCVFFNSQSSTAVMSVVLPLIHLTCVLVVLIWSLPQQQSTALPSLSDAPADCVTVWLTAMDLWSKRSQVTVYTAVRKGSNKLDLAKGKDVTEEGWGWYWRRNGQLGEGESRASCLFNIFILISALGTQRRIHPENWIISLRWVKHTSGCTLCRSVCISVHEHRGKEVCEECFFILMLYGSCFSHLRILPQLWL